MSMNKGTFNRPLDHEESFAIITLAVCEIVKNMLRDRNLKNHQRIYWIKELDKAIEGLNATYKGYLEEGIHEHSMEFHNSIEKAINKLLSKLRGDKEKTVHDMIQTVIDKEKQNEQLTSTPKANSQN